MIDQLEIFKTEIDPERGRTNAEFSFLGTCDDIRNKLIRGRRYDIIRASGLLRHLFMDGERLMDAANQRFRLKIDFYCGDDDSSTWQDALAAMKELPTSFSWWPPSVGMNRQDAKRVKLDGFLKTPVMYKGGEVALKVSDIIQTCAHVYGGVHSGTPKNNQDKLILALDEEITIGGGEPSIGAIYSICIVALDGLTPLVNAIQTDGADDHSLTAP